MEGQFRKNAKYITNLLQKCLLKQCIVIYLECYYEGKSHHHGELWSPGPCVPECRCKHGYVKCTKIECPDLNCDAPIKKKWKCCPECLPEMQDGLCVVFFSFCQNFVTPRHHHLCNSINNCL